MIRRGLLAGVLLGLAGCAGPGSCRVELAATLPMVPGEHLVAEGRMADRPARFILDTGAEVSSVTRSAAATAGLSASGQAPAQLTGIGGVVVAPMVLVPLDLGATREERPMPVLPDVRSRGGEGQALSGFLGIDVLGDFDVELDFDAKTVRLWRAGTCGSDYVPWKEAHWSMPIRRTPRGRLVTTVGIDGKEVLALIDTGASVSILAGTAARRIGVTSEALAVDPPVFGRGADGGVLRSRLHRFESVQVGPQTRRNVPISVAPSSTIGADMLLGLDWMRGLRLWISPRNWIMFARPATEPEKPAGQGAPGRAPPSPPLPGLPDAGGGRRV